jgi:hypothetical protein
LFDSILLPKLAALLFLVISLIGVKGKKDEHIKTATIITYLVTGLVLYFTAHLCFYLQAGIIIIAACYIVTTTTGYLFILSGGTLLSRLIKNNLQSDIFNTDNETFPQEECLLENEYSINLPAKYKLKGRIRKSWINIINPFRAILVAGTQGAGKSYFVIRHHRSAHQKGIFHVYL